MKSCLIVDDSSVVRKVAGRIVKDLGFECREAEDGQKAYESCMQSMPDVILLDWNMPVMTGIEFLVELRAHAEGHKPKVVFCTTENVINQIHKALEAGADEYIMKPFDSDIIQSKFVQIGILEHQDLLS